MSPEQVITLDDEALSMIMSTPSVQRACSQTEHPRTAADPPVHPLSASNVVALVGMGEGEGRRIAAETPQRDVSDHGPNDTTNHRDRAAGLVIDPLTIITHCDVTLDADTSTTSDDDSEDDSGS